MSILPRFRILLTAALVPLCGCSGIMIFPATPPKATLAWTHLEITRFKCQYYADRGQIELTVDVTNTGNYDAPPYNTQVQIWRVGTSFVGSSPTPPTETKDQWIVASQPSGTTHTQTFRYRDIATLASEIHAIRVVADSDQAIFDPSYWYYRRGFVYGPGVYFFWGANDRVQCPAI